MTQIDTKGIAVAQLDDQQLQRLMTAEKDLNNAAGGQEIYLLAVARHPGK
ncbi:MAG: hypothetical protein WCY82_04680 [Desulfotomaculaceae bacterium]